MPAVKKDPAMLFVGWTEDHDAILSKSERQKVHISLLFGICKGNTRGRRGKPGKKQELWVRERGDRKER